MSPKIAPLGICDLCWGEIPPSLGPHTSKGKPRRYCSRQCINTANSRAGSEIRAAKIRQRIADGTWVNPGDIRRAAPGDIAVGVSRVRKREVREGRWRNPALDPEARAKLSRPRKHDGVLHQAIEKLGQGAKMTDLTDEEADTYRAWRRDLYAQAADQRRAYSRRYYRKRQADMSDAKREAQRAKWRVANQRRKQDQEEKGS